MPEIKVISNRLRYSPLCSVNLVLNSAWAFLIGRRLYYQVSFRCPIHSEFRQAWFDTLEGRTVGDLISEAIRSYLGRALMRSGTASLRALRPEPYPEGNERLSSEIDAVVYGVEQ